MAVAVIEFQGFKDNNNDFIIKELAIVGDSIQCQFIFKAPYSFNQLNYKMRRTARWLTRHYHYIHWDDGIITYNNKIIRTLCKQFDIIYTSGNEKTTFLQKYHPNVQDKALNIIKENNIRCIIPSHGVTHEQCALHRACTIYDNIRRETKSSTLVEFKA